MRDYSHIKGEPVLAERRSHSGKWFILGIVVYVLIFWVTPLLAAELDRESPIPNEAQTSSLDAKPQWVLDALQDHWNQAGHGYQPKGFDWAVASAERDYEQYKAQEHKAATKHGWRN